MKMLDGEEVDFKDYERVTSVCERFSREFGISESYLRALVNGRKYRYPKLAEITKKISPKILMIKTTEFRKFILEMCNKKL